MKRIFIRSAMTCIAVFLLSFPAFAATYYVSPSGSNSNTGLSVSQAWQTITYASQNTISGDIILVLAGTYNTANGETFPINLSSGVQMIKYGSGTVLVEEVAGDYNNAVQLNGNSTLEGIDVKISDDWYYGVYLYNAANQVINCSIEGASSYCYDITAAYADNCLISGCTIKGYGYYGVYIYYSNGVSIDANSITGNFSNGSIYLSYNPYDNGTIISRNKIIGSSNTYGIYSYDSSFSVNFNEIRGFNYGVYNYYPYCSSYYGTAVNVVNNTIVKCTYPVYQYYNTNFYSYMNVKNCIISRNPDASGENDYGVFGYGLYCTSNTYYMNSSYNDVYGNYYSYYGINIGLGEKHANASFRNTATDDYHLNSGSTCRGAGEGGVDMGCYPYVEPVTLISPNGGETWEAGSQHNIRWSSDGARTQINLYYSTADAYQVIQTGLSDTGTYGWQVPDVLTSTAKVSIEGVGSGDIGSKESASRFSIVSTYDYPSIEVVAPNGGEKWQGGITQEVKWTASDSGGISEIRIFYTTGDAWVQVASGESNDGSYIWNVPSFNTSEAKIEIQAFDGSTARNMSSKESASTFIIDTIAPSIPTQETPANGGSTTEAMPTITWEASTDNLSGIAGYELVLNGTSHLLGPVTSFTPSSNLPDGTTTWEIRAVDGAGIWGDFSPVWSFDLNDTTPPVVSVSSPIGGELWMGGSLKDVNWTATDESGVNEIRIAYTSGEGWVQFASGEANTGTYLWNLPLIDTGEALVKVSAIDGSRNHNLGSDESNAYFVIDSTPPSIPVLLTPTNDSTVGSAYPTYGWNASTDNLSGVASYEFQFDGTLVGTTPAITGFTSPTPVLGTHTWSVRAKDGAGNWGSYAAPFTFTVTSDVYVDAVGGSNSKTGTNESNAWQTITYALSRVGAGQRVNVLAGTYDSALGETFVLIIPDSVEVRGYGAGNKIVDAIGSGNSTFRLGFQSILSGLMIKVDQWCDGVDMYYNGSTVQDCTIEAGDQTAGIYASADNLTIKRNKITCASGTGYSAVRCEGLSMITIESCTVSGSWSPLIYINSGNSSNQIIGNILTNESAGSDVLYVRFGSDLVVKNNLINAAGPGNGIRGNGTWTNFYINNNRVIGGSPTAGYGIRYYGNGEISSNEVRSFNYGILVSELNNADSLINNNTIVKCSYGIYNDAFNGITLNVKNTIFSSVPEVGGTPLSPSVGIHDSGNGAITTSNYNNIYNVETTYEGTINGQIGDIYGNAMFESAANNDYHLTYVSPCIYAGTPEGTDIGCYQTGPVSIQIASPNGGETWEAGSTHSILWGTMGAPNIVNIYYTVGGSYQFITTEANSKSYSWKVPDIITNEAKIKMEAYKSLTGEMVTDESNSVFSIVSTYGLPSVEVFYPSAGMQLRGSSTYEVTWFATDESGISEIQIYYSSGEGWLQVASGESNDGTYVWSIPTINTAEAKVMVKAFDASTARNAGSGESAVFTIDSTGPDAPTLEAPANGSSTTEGRPIFSWFTPLDNLSGVASYEIAIDSFTQVLGAVTSYESAISLSGGIHTWEVVARDGVGNWGVWSASWEVTILDINPPQITVEAPSGGETLIGNSSYAVQFSATDESGIMPNSLGLWYSIDDGANYLDLITADASSVSPYSWTVQNIFTTEARVRATIRDNAAYHNIGTGESAAKFNIIYGAPSIGTLTPGSGYNNQFVTGETITGSGFKDGAQVKLTKTGESDIVASNVVVAGDAMLTCDLDLTGKRNGAWDVIVTNPGGQAGTQVGGFTISLATPEVTSVVPSWGVMAGGTSVSINGSNFWEYPYMRNISVTNSGSVLSNYQVMFNFDTATPILQNKMRSDCGDIRIKDNNMNDLPFWIKPTSINSANTEIWVKMPSIAASSTETIYITYGNLTLSSSASGDATFDFFDGFDNDSIGSKWQIITNSYTYSDTSTPYCYIENGTAIATSDVAWQAFETKTANFTRPFIIEARIKADNSVISYADGIFFATKGADYNSGCEHSYLTLSGGNATPYLRHNGSNLAGSSFGFTVGTYYLNSLILTPTQVITKLSTDNRSYISGYTLTDSSNDNKCLGLDHYQANTRSYFDYVYVRKYAASEPTVTVSSETYGEFLKVYFDNLPAASYSRASASLINAVTPAHPAGAVSVTVINSDGGVGTKESGFTYSKPPIKVYTPTTGDAWAKATTHNITWESNIPFSSVNIYYSSNNGSSYTPLATGETDDGVYPWYINQNASATAKIKVEGVSAEGNATDESSTFTVLPPNDFYVDIVNGSNSNNGLTSEVVGGGVGPWKTLTYAIANTSAGNVIHAAPGYYRSYSGTGETFPISFSSKTLVSTISKMATIDSETASANTVNIGSSGTLDGFSVSSSVNSSSYYCVNFNSSNAKLLNGAISQSGSSFYGQTINVQGSCNNNLIENNLISSLKSYYDIYLNSYAYYTIIRNNQFNTGYNYASGAVVSSSYCNGTTVEGNTINASAGININGTGLDINNNKIIITGAGYGHGITIGSGGSVSITYNEIRGSISYLYSGYYAISCGSPGTINHNTIVDNKLGIQVNTTGIVTIKNNIIAPSPKLGGYWENSQGIEQYNGTVNSSYNNIFNVEKPYKGTISSSSDVYGCPRFVAPDSNDYRLLSDSPDKLTADDGGNRGKYGSIASASSIFSQSFVSVGGNDANTGTSESQAWRHLTYALQNTEGTINVLDGRYALGETFPFNLYAAKLAKYPLTAVVTIDSAANGSSTLIMGPVSLTLEGYTVKSSTTGSYYIIRATCPNTMIRNNILSQEGTSGINGAIYLSSVANYSTIEGNSIYSLSNDSSHKTLNCESANIGTAVRNNFISNSSGGIAIGLSAAGLTIEGNTVASPTGCDLYGDYLVRNNIFIGNGANYGLKLNSGGTVTSNEIRSNYNGIYINSPNPIIIDHNTIVKNQFGIDTSYSSSIGTITIKNNIISAAPRLGDYFAGSIGIRRYYGTFISTHNNLFNNELIYSGAITSDAYDNTLYPRFVYPSGNDYRLYSDSPCIGTATDLGNRGWYGSIGFASPISAESYVSSLTGNDVTGEGTESHPWKTITRALISTEGTVYVMEGSYTNTAGETFPLALSNSKLVKYTPTAVVTIDSGNVDANTVVITNAGTTLEGFIIRSSSTGSNRNTVYIGASGVKLLNNKISQEATSGSGATVYINEAGNNCVIDNNAIKTKRSYALQSYTGSNYGPNSVTVTNNNLIALTTAGYGFAALRTNWCTIEGNTINANRGVRIEVDNNLVVRNNKITAYNLSDSNDNGVALIGGAGLVASNEIRGYGYPTSDYGYSNGIYCSSGGPYTILHNTIIKNQRGVSLNGSANVIVRNNIINAAPALGGYFAGSYGIKNSGSGIATSEYNNLFNNFNTYGGAISSMSNDNTLYPRFVNTAADDYRLYTDSPCSGTADDLGNRGRYETYFTSSPVLSQSYVSGGGNDSNLGTEGSPWRTITKALSQTEGTVYLMDGLYNSAAGETFPIPLSAATLSRYQPATVATIDSGALNSHTVVMLLAGSTLEGIKITSNNTFSDNYCVYMNRSNQTITNCIVSQEGSGASGGIDIGPLATYAVISNSRIRSIYGKTINIEQYADHPSILNNSIANNYPSFNSNYSAVYVNAATSPLIEGNTIIGDYGIYNSGSSTNYLYRNNKVRSYTSSQTGSYYYCGLYLYGTGTAELNEIRGYQATYGYGGIYTSSGTHLLNRNTIVKNRRGIYTSGTTTIKNNIIASEIGGYSAATTYGIYNGSTATSTYNDVYANDTNYYNISAGTGDKSLDAMFIASTEANNFHLKFGSPCIDAGTPEGTEMGCYDYSFSVNLTSPNGGETWEAGSTHNITWTTTGVPDSINLYYSLNNGGAYNTIATGISDTGSYPWFITGPATSQAKVKIESVSVDLTATDESNSTFNIIPAHDYYVDINIGSNSNTGLSAEASGAWKNLSYALTQETGSAVIHVAAGAYTADSGESFPISYNGKTVTGTSLATIDSDSLDVDTFVAGNGAVLNGCTLHGNAASYGRAVLKITGSNVHVNSSTISSEGHCTISLEAGANNVWFNGDIITNNHSGSYGLYMPGGDGITVESSTISGNYGIYQAGANTNCTIRSNVIYGVAPSQTGIYLNGNGNVTLNEIRGFASAEGGGIYCTAGGPFTINKNTIVKNAVGVRVSVNSYIVNSIIAAGVGGYSITGTKGIVQTAGTASNEYNDLYNNETTLEGTVTEGTGTLHVDPYFADASADNYHLTVTSECIDSGNPDPIYNDPDGTRADMGAYYLTAPITATLESPVGGESWKKGTWQNITWETFPGNASYMNIYYSNDGGATYSTLAAGAPDSGYYQWFIDKNITNEARIKIEAVRANVSTSESANFTITSPTDFYVDPIKGSNGGYNGLTSEVSGINGPWKNLTYAATAAAVGTTVHAAPGYYNQATGESFPMNLSGRKFSATQTWLASIEEDTVANSILEIGNNTTIEGFSFRGSNNFGANMLDIPTGINNVAIRNCYLDTSSYDNGIYSNGTSISVELNTLKGYSNTGIHLWADVDSYSVYRNTLYGFSYGIMDRSIHSGSIDRNTVVSCGTGILIDELAGTTGLTNNIICNVPVLDQDFGAGTRGLYAANTAQITASNNNIWKNETDILDSIILPGFLNQSNAVSQFPGFVNPSINDYRLLASTGNWTNPNIGTGAGSVNIGAYDGLGVAGSPYVTESYVNAGTGSDMNQGTNEAQAWKTLTYANHYTVHKINVDPGLYNAANGEGSFPMNFSLDRYVKGSGWNTTTIETTNFNIISLHRNSSIEGLSLSRTAAGGTGALVKGTNTYIKNVAVTKSASGAHNTAIDLQASNSTIEGCLITEYSSYGINIGNVSGINIYKNEIRGGAIGIYMQGSGTINRNTIVKSTTGIANSGGYYTVKNNIINNQPLLNQEYTFGSYGINNGSGSIEASYNDVWKNNTNYNSSSGTLHTSESKSEFPGFVDAANNDYHLQKNSAYWTNPCIAAGEFGVNMGCYDGSSEALMGYLDESFVIPSGNNSNTGASWGSPWQTITFANAHTTHKINLGAGTYNAANGEGAFPINFSIDRYIKGVDRYSTTIESDTGYGTVVLGSASSIEEVTLKTNSGTYLPSVLVKGMGVVVKNNIIRDLDHSLGIETYSSAQVSTDNLTVEGNLIYGDGAYQNIEGVYIVNTQTYDRHFIRRNEIRGYKVGIYIGGNNGQERGAISRNTIVKNYYGIQFNSNISTAAAVVSNNIIVNQPALDSDFYFVDNNYFSLGIYSDYAFSTLDHNLIWKNYYDYLGNVIHDSTNIYACPRFVNPWEGNDYRLYQGSPCLNAGSENGSPVNIGAYDGSGEAGSPYLDESFVIGTGSDLNSGASWGNAWRTLTNANKWTIHKINVGTGEYSTLNGEAAFPRNFSIDRYVLGTDRVNAIVSGNGNNVIDLNRNSSVEGLTLNCSGGGSENVVEINGAGAAVRNNIINAVSNPRNTYGIHSWFSNVTIESNAIYGSSNASFLSDYNAGIAVENYYNVDPTKVSNIYRNEVRGFSIGISTIIRAPNFYNFTARINRNTLVKDIVGIQATVSTVETLNNIIASEIGGYSYGGTTGINLAAGSATSTYNDVYANDTNWSGLSSGTGDFSLDAQFVDPLVTNDYHIWETSPARDSGLGGVTRGAYDWVPDTRPPDVTVIIPAGGEIWAGGTTHEVTFSGSDLSGIQLNSANIYYTTGEGWVPIATGQPTDQAYSWTIPMVSSSNAHIRVTMVDDSPQHNLGTGESVAFTLTSSSPEVTVITPNGGETLTQGSTYEITWIVTDETGLKPNPITIKYSVNSGSDWSLIASNEANDGQYVWTVPNVLTTHARVSVEAIDLVDKIGTDMSDADFTITGDVTGPAISITTPNGGEKWRGGISHNIVFNGTDPSGIKTNSANFYYSTGEGTAWLTIATGQPTDQAYSWPVPAISTTEAKVRITMQDNSPQYNMGTKESFAVFLIDSTSPEVSLIQPNGGEMLTGGTTYEIKWTASDECGLKTNPITLRYSTNSGTSWSLITSGIANNGSYTWNLPSITSSTVRVSVEAENQVQMINSDKSNADFTIVSGTPVVGSIVLSDRISGSTQYTNQLTISLEAFNVSADAVAMRIALDSGFTTNETAWLLYDSKTEYTLTSGEGSRTVYYKIRNLVSTESNVVNASIIVDTATPGAVSLLTPPDNSYTNEAKPLFTWNAATDTTSGIGLYQIVIDGTTLSAGTATSYRPGTNMSDGLHNWKVRAQDRALNWGDYSPTWNVTVDVTPPIVNIVAPTAGIVLARKDSPYSILWTATDGIGLAANPISIYLSSNGGSTWGALASHVSNSGTLSWDLPVFYSNACRIRVEAVDLAGNTGTANTNNFTIDGIQPEVVTLEVTKDPNGAAKLDSPIVIKFSKAVDRQSAQNAFTITPQITGTFSWSTDNITMTFTPASNLAANTNYSVVIGTGVKDIYGNPLAQEFRASFSTIGDITPPTVSLKYAGRTVWPNDYVTLRPNFDAYWTDDTALDLSTLKAYIDGRELKATIISSTATTAHILFETTFDLEDETIMNHTLRLEARDMAGNLATKEVLGLRVSKDAVRTVGPNLITPTPLNSGSQLTLIYTLNRDADIGIYVIGPTGRQEITRKYLPYFNGGMAGYNEIVVDAVSDITGARLANGIYVVRILASGNRVIGTAHLVVNWKE